MFEKRARRFATGEQRLVRWDAPLEGTRRSGSRTQVGGGLRRAVGTEKAVGSSMEVILNGETMTLDVSDCANLAELVAEAERLDVRSEPSVLVGISIDGEPLSSEELGELESRALEGVRRVEIQRRPTHEVASSVLRQGALYSTEIIRAIERTVEHFRCGRSDLANELLAHVSDSLAVFVGISASVATVIGERAEELAERQSQLHPWLEQMIEAQSGGDPIRVGDLLEFEIAPRIQSWGERMQALSDGATPEPYPSGSECISS